MFLMRRIAVAISRLVVASCLMLATVSAYLWARSTHKEDHFSYHTSAARYKITSSDGFITIYGPPAEGNNEAADIALASRMSNDDFAWGSPVQRNGKWYIEGDVRPGSATFEMFERYSRKIVRMTGGLDRADHLEFAAPDDPPPGLEAITRVFLNALEDPHRVCPAHMMLCFLVDRFKVAHTRNDDFTNPYLILPTAPRAAQPILEGGAELRRYWHERFDVNRFSIHYAALCAATLLIPFVRAAKPRRKRGIATWAFNASALISFAWFTALVGIWIDSYFHGHIYRHGREWPLDVRRSAAPAAPSTPMSPALAPAPLASNWYVYRWVGWSKGQLQWLQRTAPIRPARMPRGDRFPYWVLETAGKPQVTLRSGGFLRSSVIYYSDRPKILAPGARSGSGPLPFAALPTAAAPPATKYPPATWNVPPLPAASVPASMLVIPPGVLKTDPKSPSVMTSEGQSIIVQSSGTQIVVDLPPNISTISAQTMLQRSAAAVASSAQLQAAALVRIGILPQPLTGTETVIVSLWVPVVLTGILPLLWVLVPLRREMRGAIRRKRHLCPNCSYDIRATPNRCPECGTVFTAAAIASN